MFVQGENFKHENIKHQKIVERTMFENVCEIVWRK